MTGIGIIANPHSKENKRNPHQTSLFSYILGQRGHLEVTESIEDLAKVARDFRQKQIEIVAINGGDGSVHCTIRALLQEFAGAPLPTIVLLRGGTMNVLANNLGIRGRPEDILYRLVERHGRGEIFARRSIRMLSANGQLGFLYADGVATRFLERFYQNKNGRRGVAWLLLRAYWSYWRGTPFYKQLIFEDYVEARFDNDPPISLSSVAMFGSTLERIPLGQKLFPHITTIEDQFQTVVFTMRPADVPLKILWLALRGWPTTRDELLRVNAGRLTARSKGLSSFTLDGELFEARGEVELKLGPTIEFVVI